MTAAVQELTAVVPAPSFAAAHIDAPSNAFGRLKPAALVTGPMRQSAMWAADGARNMAQGAVACLLALAGAVQMSSGPVTAAPGDFGFAGADLIYDLAGSVAGANLMAGAQILGAVALFLIAGRGFARVVGVLGFLAVAVLYLQGVETMDVFARAEKIVDAFNLAVTTFVTAASA